MLKSLSLQNFRNYKKSTYDFGRSTIIIGPNTAGKSNLIESIFLLSSGKSFRAEKDSQMVRLGNEMGRVSAQQNSGEPSLEVVVTVGEVAGVRTQYKRFFVNGVAKRRADFAGNLPSVLFSPQDLELVGGSPGKRREFLDNVLEQTDRDYRIAHLGFTKALKQRNALLELVKETGRNADKQLEYWDNLVIRNGSVVTQKREKFINFLNEAEKSVFDFKIEYDRSEISRERLVKYYDAERASGVTLVGPQRDDVFIYFPSSAEVATKAESDGQGKSMALKSFGSRGQQRLGVLQLKLIELNYIKEKLEEAPILLLDDIFSELDEEHINLILSIIGNQQTILTTTHEEFIPTSLKGKMEVIELDNK